MKIALVTGASSGIGEQTVEVLLQHGYRVYAGARRVERMQALAAKGAVLMALDLTDETSIQAAVQQIIVADGKVDVLVNNAGYGSLGAMEDVAQDEARRQFEVNVFGLARLTQLVIPYMRQQKSGKIVNISSMGGKFTMPYEGWYHATKYAVEAISDAMRLELAVFGIDVIIVEPGAIYTEWQNVALDNLRKSSAAGVYAEPVERFANMMESHYNERTTKPEAVAKVVVQAVLAKRPKIRYTVGMDAKAVTLLKRLLPDRCFEQVVKMLI